MTFKNSQLTFLNTKNNARNALAFGDQVKFWDDGRSDVAYNDAVTAGAVSNTSDKRPVSGATSLSSKFYESALWTVEDADDPSDNPGQIKELRAKWVNDDFSSTSETLFAINAPFVFITNDAAKLRADFGTPDRKYFPVKLKLRSTKDN